MKEANINFVNDDNSGYTPVPEATYPAHVSSFKMNEYNRWQADIYGLAKIRLKNTGVSLIYGGEYCTFYDDELFFSYRRENICGRMASMIYIK